LVKIGEKLIIYVSTATDAVQKDQPPPDLRYFGRSNNRSPFEITRQTGEARFRFEPVCASVNRDIRVWASLRRKIMSAVTAASLEAAMQLIARRLRSGSQEADASRGSFRRLRVTCMMQGRANRLLLLRPDLPAVVVPTMN